MTSADLIGLWWVESSSILSFNLWLAGSIDYDLFWPGRTMLSRILLSLNLWLPDNTDYDLCWPDRTMLSRILLSLNLWLPGNNQVSRGHLCWPDRTMMNRTSSAFICDYLATLLMTTADLLRPCWVEPPELEFVTTWQQSGQQRWPLLTW